ncbi:MAG: DUF3943 domain-containing protein [Gammaproteobacteria bacterium]
MSRATLLGIVCLFLLPTVQAREAGLTLDPWPPGYEPPSFAGCTGADTDECDVGLPSADGRDRAGLRRDTWYFVGTQFAVIAILYTVPESVSGWTDEQKKDYSLSNWWDNVTHPTWDSDDWYLNYLLHPYWGGAYYVRARERGYPGAQAVAYSALLSAIYEFGAEALFEPVSIQDLIVTPLVGSLVGTYFMHLRDGIRTRERETGARGFGDSVLWIATDPLGAVNRQIDRWFGWEESSVSVRPYYLEKTARPDQYGGLPHEFGDTEFGDTEFGIRFHVAWQ